MLAGKGMEEQNKPEGTSLSALSTSLWLCGTSMSMHLQVGQLISSHASQPQPKTGNPEHPQTHRELSDSYAPIDT